MLDYLHNNALWIIMDPWMPHPWPKDLAKYPGINEHNNKTLVKIVDYLPKLKHVVVSCPTCFTVDSRLVHLYNTGNFPHNVHQYMATHKLSNIVYCGFHHGRCIINKGDGAKMMKLAGYTLWELRALTSLWVEDTWDWGDQESKPYLTIIEE